MGYYPEAAYYRRCITYEVSMITVLAAIDTYRKKKTNMAATLKI